MKKLVLFSFLAFGFVLASCAFKANDAVSAQDQQFEDANNKLKAEYTAAEGLYHGEIQRPGYKKGMQVDIRLVVLSVQSGTGSSGKERQLAKLLGVFTEIESNKDSVEMSATFDANSGRLSLSSTSPSSSTNGSGSNSSNPTASMSLNNSDIAFLEGSLVNGHISATVKARQGILGQLEASRISTSPALETVNEKISRYNRFNEKIVGVYDSVMVLQFSSGPSNTPIRFTITPGSIDKPALSVSCYSGLFGQAPMNVNYGPHEEPPYISLSSISTSNSGAPGSVTGVCAYSKLEGRMIEDKVIADVTSLMGDVQHLTFTKRKK